MNQGQSDRIEAYLRDNLPPEEKVAFEAELAADPALAEQVAMRLAQRKVAELFIEDELRAEVKKWRVELEDEPVRLPARGKNVRLWWWGAVSAAASLLLLLYFFFPEPPPSPPDTTNKSIPGESEPEEEIYGTPNKLILDTVLTLTSLETLTGPIHRIKLLVYDVKGKPSYSFDGDILELRLSKDSLGKAQELGALKSEKNTGEIFFLKMKNQLYPIFQTDTLLEMKRL